MYDCPKCQLPENSWYLGRNCRYFPDQPTVVNYRWNPEFRTANGSPFYIDRVECDECPRSLVNSESLYHIETRFRLKKASDLGIQVFAPGQVQARTVDAMVVLQTEETAYEMAYAKAVELEQPNGNRHYED